MNGRAVLSINDNNHVSAPVGVTSENATNRPSGVTSSGCWSAGRLSSGSAGALPSAYADADKVPFTRPVPARNWLQASNPSERWKWDFLYQDLPPVKGHNVQMENVAAFIPLKPVG